MQSENTPKETYKEVGTLTAEDYPLCFSDTDNDRKFGCIGHMRGDFGGGREFWHTWWGHRSELNTEMFKSEFNLVVAGLRRGPLKSLDDLRKYCRENPQTKLPERFRENEYLLKLSSERFNYYARLNPAKGDYNFYIYCYDRKAGARGHSKKKERSEPER